MGKLAHRAGEVVCLLHRGLTAGVVATDPDARLTAFQPRDPYAAGCEIRLGRPAG